VLAEAAMAEPENPALPLLLSKLLIQAARYDEAHAVLSAVPPKIREHPGIRRLGTHLELIQSARTSPPTAELATRLVGDPDDCDARFSLAARCLMKDDYAGALDLLADLHRRAPDYRGGLPRRAMVTVLDLLGPEDERVRRYRQLLFRH
jgi:putative thioredoxin